jgi:hypothetical protein
MTDLPELPQTAQTHIQSMIEMARGEVQLALTSIDNAAEATSPTRDQHFEEARASVREATNLLFNACAQEHLQANRVDLLSLLPAICHKVELAISCPRFEAVVSEAAREQKVKWTYRMAIEAAVSIPEPWRHLSDEFGVLVKKEHEIQGIRDRLRLFATGTYKPGDGDNGYWWLTNGPRDGVRTRFDALAKRAGITLVPPQGTQTGNYRDYWLHCLSLYLAVNDSANLTQGEDHEHNKSYMMHNLPESSEAFASRLEECARENEQREKAISTAAAPKAETGESLKPSEEGAENPQKVGGATSLNSRGQGHKRGPKPDLDSAVRVATIVARIAPDADWRSKLDDLREALMNANVPFPQRWRSLSWSDQEDALVIKVIKRRLDMAKLGRKTPA